MPQIDRKSMISNFKRKKTAQKYVVTKMQLKKRFSD